MTEHPVVVADRIEVACGVVVLVLARADGGTLPPWRPGAHIDVAVPGSLRQYSLCGTPGDLCWRIGVLREPDGRGGSVWLHDAVRVGDRLQVSGPRQRFTAPPGNGGLVFVAGGIGITPLVPMLTEARRAGRPYVLHYAGRSRRAMAFLLDLEAEHPGRVHVHASDEGNRLDVATVLDVAPAGDPVVCCGPATLIDAVEAAAQGRPVHVERFVAAVQDHLPDDSFEVELAVSGAVALVSTDRPLIDVLEECGAWVVSSCREGVCGTCETRVLSGTVEHRDSILTPDQRARHDVIYPCVSRGRGRLVLDL